ncbi:MAG: DUF3825 domain-containing protein [Allomuricauda sp.]|uniref:DNA-binding cold-shock protein n=1 Tax=Allomuricauda ruestringensis (strain DSM 13258 / CIP 107369 / LMG 19739 / B1) TaxID=886377 RepID=G2PIZ8_ALLRU|nr:DUF3825 domain-containing protein [Allomuricauda ruestringensis]AEM70797.1 DNA-binding cold-shock protein [Allomuricauda ruestringensis DSM 13258]
MTGKIKFYNNQKGYGWLYTEKPEEECFFHISNVEGELQDLISCNKYEDEPLTFVTKPSTTHTDRMVAENIRLDLSKRNVGFVDEYDKGYGRIICANTDKNFFFHHSKLVGSENRYIRVSKGDPVIFTGSENDKGLEALEVVVVDNRSSLEKFAEFDNFYESLSQLKVVAQEEDWDYIKNRTGYDPVLYSYINHTFNRIESQDKLVLGKSSVGKEYAIFNTGLATKFQDDVYAYFQKLDVIDSDRKWKIKEPQYRFLEFNTDQSHFRKYLPKSPEIATYFSEAEITELIYDYSLNGGEIIIDREHIISRRSRFPSEIRELNDEKFLDTIKKGIELALRRIKRNYKTAIPHYYDGKIQFLMPLCLVSKSEADLALVVNKEEYVYKAHTVLTLDQAYNNARLLAKPDREWLNP